MPTSTTFSLETTPPAHHTQYLAMDSLVDEETSNTDNVSSYFETLLL